jgi:phosphoribosylanthranilate isomerase
MGNPIIKAARITNLTDARYFAAKEVDFLGFNLEEGTEGYLDPMYMKAMREWVQGPKIVGEYAVTPARIVREAADFFTLEGVQLRASAHVNDLDLFEGYTVLLHVDTDLASAFALMEQTVPKVAYFILDVSTEQWPHARETLQQLCVRFPVLLNPHVHPSLLPEIMEALQPAGLNLTGGEEEKVGVKSFDELEEIFELFEV